MVNDPIADLLTRIRNGYMAGLPAVSVPHSEMKYAISKILQKNEFVHSVELGKDEKGFKTIELGLMKFDKNVVRPTFKRVSKPGRRVYMKYEELKPVNSGYGIGIVSTSKGVMTSYEAREAKIGGEYLCEVY